MRTTSDLSTLTMDIQLVKLFVMNCLAHLCLSASISTAPLTTPACFPGSSSVNECMSYNCDENGQWQEFEFTRTRECCLKYDHPACGEWDTTYTEFISNTESPSTTSLPPACKSGWMKTKECRVFYCQDGQWQVGEFTATKECCLQNFNPKCGAMGFTSTGQATGVTSTEFISTTESPPTTTATSVCDSGTMKTQDCRFFFCQDGQWQVGEFTATKDCCLQNFHPKCQAMGFTPTGPSTGVSSTELISTTESTQTTTVCISDSFKTQGCTSFLCQDGQWVGGEFTVSKDCCLQDFHPECQIMGFTNTGQARGVKSTEFISTTESPPTTPSTSVCDSGSEMIQDCMMFFCQDGQWQVGEFTATKDCCLQNFHPKCQAMGFTSTEFISTTESPPTTPSTSVCDSGSGKIQDCSIYICQDGQWQVGEFTATTECCLKELHPKCIIMGFTGQATGVTSTGKELQFTSTELTPTTIPTTTLTAACTDGSNREQDCTIHLCLNGEWQPFEFTATQECCLKEFHPMCQAMGFTSTEFISTTESPPTTSSTSVCDSGSVKIQDCRIFICQDGQWQVGEFTATTECCLKELHPKCIIMGFTGQATGVTSTEFISTTESPPTTTSTSVCDSGSEKIQDCWRFFCQDGQWLSGEFTATKDCCLQDFHPICQAMGFTSTELISTTESPPTTTSTSVCDSGTMKTQDCRFFYCQNGQWLVGEFSVTKDCCLQNFHPRCQIMGFTTTGLATGVTATELLPTTIPTTTLTAACTYGSSREQDCTIHVCVNGEWQPFEFTATQECCLKEFHPKCILMGFTVSSSSTSSPNSNCSPGSSRVQDCGVYLCEEGQWQLFEFFASDKCCLNEFHPKCAALGTTHPDDSKPEDWPLKESDSSERLDILLVRIPLLPDLPFPVAYRNGGPMNSHKDTSGGPKKSNHAVHHRE